MRYDIDNGVDSTVEFQGLSAQYLFIFVIGLFLDFIAIVTLIMIGVSAVISAIVGVVIASGVIFYSFSMNKKYGRHGLMKKLSVATRPKHIRVNVSVRKLLRDGKKRV